VDRVGVVACPGAGDEPVATAALTRTASRRTSPSGFDDTAAGTAVAVGEVAVVALFDPRPHRAIAADVDGAVVLARVVVVAVAVVAGFRAADDAIAASGGPAIG